MRAEKKEKKHFEKQKKAMGLDGAGTSMLKSKEPVKPVTKHFQPTLLKEQIYLQAMPLDVPRDISQLSAGARELAEKYKVL